MMWLSVLSRVGTVEFWGKSPCYWKQLVWVWQWYGLRSHVHIWFWDFYRPPCFIVIFWIMLSQRFYLSYCLLHTHTHPFNGPFSGTTRVSRYQKGKTGFYWSKRQWVAVASAGPYASLHLAPDRQPCQHPTTQVFLQAGCPFCRPTDSVKALKAILTVSSN